MPYLSLQEAAALVGVNPRTLRRRIAEGALPAYRVGRLVRIKPDDVQRLFRKIPTVRSIA
jgi:excisionase family DNA binding protein